MGLVRLLLKLRLELLLLLLKEVHTTQTEAHHVCGHHVREHVREAEGHGLLVMTTSSCTELLQALELSLSLSEVRREVTTALKVVDATIYRDIRVLSRVAMTGTTH